METIRIETEKELGKTNNRIIYLDYLRILATFAVIMVHVTAYYWPHGNVNSYEWKIINVYASLVRWCVPAFVMISGTLFLNRDIPVKLIYKKYVCRMFTAYVVWSSLYYLLAEGISIQMIRQQVLNLIIGNTTECVMWIINGYYHMWFIPMISGVYMCLPIIKHMAKSERISRYYMGMAFVFAFGIPTIVNLANDFGNAAVTQCINVLNGQIANMHMGLVLGYTSLFLLGYYLDKIEFAKKQYAVVMVLGGVGFIATVMLSEISSVRAQTPMSRYHEYFSVSVLCEAIAVFVLFKVIRFKANSFYNIIIRKMSKWSFGAFLIHMLILEHLPLTAMSIEAGGLGLSIPMISIIVFILAFAISGILNNIPIIKKYIV